MQPGMDGIEGLHDMEDSAHTVAHTWSSVHSGDAQEITIVKESVHTSSWPFLPTSTGDLGNLGGSLERARGPVLVRENGSSLCDRISAASRSLLCRLLAYPIGAYLPGDCGRSRPEGI